MTVATRGDYRILAPDGRLDLAATVTLLREATAALSKLAAMNHFQSGRVQLSFLESDHPFLAKELIRQGIRTKEDLPTLPSAVVGAIEQEVLDPAGLAR